MADPLDSPALQMLARQIHAIALTSDDWSIQDMNWLSAVIENPLSVVPELPGIEVDRASALALRAISKRLRDSVPGESWSPRVAERVKQWLTSPRDVVRYGALLAYFEARHASPDGSALHELRHGADPLLAATARAMEGVQ